MREFPRCGLSQNPYRGTLSRYVLSEEWKKKNNEVFHYACKQNEVNMKIAIGIVAVAASLITSAALRAPAVAASLQASAQISGQVVDARDGSPLPHVQILAVSASTKDVESTAFADRTGHFTLRGLRGDSYRLVFARSGYGQAYADGITVSPSDHLVMISPFAVQAVPVAMIQELGMRPQCGSLIQPDQTSDVYVVCSGS